MKFIYFVLISLAFFKPIPAPAEMPDGADDRAFQGAVEIWLSDDDATSLPALARLAQNGKRAAQILLGQIELHEVKPSRWLAALSRNERRAIFRAPGGKFGKPWLKIAAEHEPLARALQAARNPEQMEEVIPTLYELGAYRAMGPAISRLLNHWKWKQLVEYEHQRVFPPEQQYTAWYAALFVSSAEANRLTIEATQSFRKNMSQSAMYLALARDQISSTSLRGFGTFLPIARFFSNGEIDLERPEIAKDLSSKFLEMDETRQLAFACRSICPMQAGSCVAAAWSMLGGYSGYLALGSPVATQVPASRYEETQRATGELLRRLAHVFQSGTRYQGIVASSSCLWNTIQPIVSR